MGLGEGDERFNRIDPELGMDDQDEVGARRQRDRREALDRIERQLAVEEGIEVERAAAGGQQRVAVRRGARDRGGGDVAVGAGPVLDHDGLTEPSRQFLADRAGDGVDRAAGRDRHHDVNRLGRIRRLGVRPRNK